MLNLATSCVAMMQILAYKGHMLHQTYIGPLNKRCMWKQSYIRPVKESYINKSRYSIYRKENIGENLTMFDL